MWPVTLLLPYSRWQLVNKFYIMRVVQMLAWDAEEFLSSLLPSSLHYFLLFLYLNPSNIKSEIILKISPSKLKPMGLYSVKVKRIERYSFSSKALLKTFVELVCMLNICKMLSRDL